MKKTLTFLAVAILATASQAATISWKSGTAYLADGTKVGASGAPTVTAYFILTNDDISSFDGAKYVTENVDKTTGFKGTADKQVTANAFGATWSNQGNYNAGDSQNMIMLFTYEKDGQIFGWATATTGTIGADGKATSVNNMAAAIDSAAKAQASGAWTPVPEPTSVALLALGLAALGLKRKIA